MNLHSSGGGDAEGSLDDHLDVAAQGRLEVHGGVGEAGLDGIAAWRTGGAGWLICHRAPWRSSATMETTCRPSLADFGPDYDQTVGTLAFATLRDVHLAPEPGDPDRAAQIILTIAGMDEPPLRLLLGVSAYRTWTARQPAAPCRRPEVAPP